MDSVNTFVEQASLNLSNLVNMVSTLDEQAWIKIVIIYLLFLWCAIIIWVIRDVSMRGGGFLWQLFSVLLILFLTPILGLPLYLLIRPTLNLYSYDENIPDTPASSYQGETEVLPKTHCPQCTSPVETDFIFCPYCQHSLKTSCTACNKMIRSDWKICPYCGHRSETPEKKSSKKEERS